MAIISSPVKRVKGVTWSPLALYSGVDDFNTQLNDDSDPNKSIRLIFDVLGITSDLSSIITAVYGSVTNARKDLDKAIKALNTVENTTEALEVAAKLAKKIPNTFVKKIGKPVEKAAGDAEATIEDVKEEMIVYRDKLQKFEDQFSIIRKVAQKFDDLSFLVIPALEEAVVRMVDFGREQSQHLSQLVTQEFGTIADLNSDGDTIGSTEVPNPEEIVFDLLQIEMPDEVKALLEEAFDVWDARLAARDLELAEIRDALEELFSFAADVKAKASTTLNPDVTLPELKADLGVGEKLAIIFGLGDYLDPLEPVSSAINKGYKIVKPVLDVAFLLGDIIDEVIDFVIDAIGAGGAVDKAVAGINALLAPLTDQINALKEVGPSLPGFGLLEELSRLTEVFEALWEGIQSFVEKFNALEREPVILTGIDLETNVDLGGDDDLSGLSILVGLDGNDTLRLGEDPNFDDGHGGYALGGNDDDKIFGTEKRDLIFGGAGDDEIHGYGDDDLLFGGSGSDKITGGAGNDAILGGADADVLEGGAGNDKLYGEGGADVLIGGDDDDILDGGAGADTLYAGRGRDVLRGDAGIDTLYAGSGINLLDGGAGLDLINTLGEATAINTIIDATAVLSGGAGREIVRIGDAYKSGAVIPTGLMFDGSANLDRFETSSVDLIALVPHILNFEELGVAGEGAPVVLSTDIASLLNFEQLDLYGSDAITINVVAGDLQMNGVLQDGANPEQPFLIDFNDMSRIQSVQDGVRSTSKGMVDLTIQLADGGAVVDGQTETSVGVTFLGGTGVDTITGGNGSDIIRGGMGGDILSGGLSDTGNRFDLEDAIGDVILGTPEELNGDVISDLSNRVDRVRILGNPDDFDVALTIDDAHSTVTITDKSTGAVTGQFTLIGVFPELTFRPGSFGSGADETQYVEVFNNNIPPTAVDDDYRTGYQVVDDPYTITPFDNDYDLDTPAVAENDYQRRSVAVAQSLDALFGATDTDDEDQARLDFPGLISNIDDLPSGTEFDTKLGNKVIWTGTELVYEALQPVVTPIAVPYLIPFAGGFRFIDIYDAYRDLPFFGRDQFAYKVFDSRGELSNEAVVDFLIRPDAVLQADGSYALPKVFQLITQADGSVTEQAVSLIETTGALNGALRPTGLTSATDPGLTAGGNYYVTITDPGNYRGGAGNDVLDARGATGSVFLWGGDLADWVEGGDYDDVLSGSGLFVDSVSFDGSYIAEDILLGGGGSNLFLANAEGLVASNRDRDSVFVLDGDEDTITGPIAGVNFLDPYNRLGATPSSTSLATYGLNGDTVIGFDGDDQIVVPIDVSNLETSKTTGLTFGPGGTFRMSVLTQAGIFSEVKSNRFTATDSYSVSQNITVTKKPGLILTSMDASDFLGQSNAFLTDVFDGVAGVERSSKTGGIEWAVSYEIPVNASQSDMNIIGASASIYETAFNFEAAPDIISYDIEAVNSGALAGTTPSTTTLKVSFESFGFETSVVKGALTKTHDVWDPQYVGDGDYRLYISERKHLAYEQSFTATAQLVRTNDYLDPANIAYGNGLSFEMEFDGYYNTDRFVVEFLDQSAPTSASPASFTDLATPTAHSTGAYDFAYFDSNDFNLIGANGQLGFALRYDSSPIETQADFAQVYRGEGVTFDLLANDTDPDGDKKEIFDIAFNTAQQDLDYFDGDLSNGELILEKDTNSGFGTGVVTFIAPEAESAVGTFEFHYIATDGEFQSAAELAMINIQGLPPVASDDIIVLPYDTTPSTDGHFFGIAPVVFSFVTPSGANAIGDILENDVDPDTGEIPEINDIGIRSGSDFIKTFASLGVMGMTAEAFAKLQSDTIGANGEGGAFFSFEYTLVDQVHGGERDPATVQVFVAAELSVAPDAAVDTIAEDTAWSVDLQNGRVGGYGALSVVDPDLIKAYVIDPETGLASSVEAGTVSVSDNSILFTARGDLSGVDVEIRLVQQDALGSTLERVFGFAITPVADAAVAQLDGAGSGSLISAIEDTAITGGLLLYDVDDIQVLSADETDDFLHFVDGRSASVSDAGLAKLAEISAKLVNVVLPDAGALTADTRVQLQDPGASVTYTTAQNGTFTLTPVAFSGGDHPLEYSYTYTPAENATGSDSVSLAYVSSDLALDPTTSVDTSILGELRLADVPTFTFEFDIAAVNDAPEFITLPEPFVVALGDSVQLDLLADAYDVDRDGTSLIVTDLRGPDGAIAELALNTDDLEDLSNPDTAGYVLTTLGSGTSEISYFVQDADGARTLERTLSFTVNQAPEAADDAYTVFGAGEVLLLDLLRNDFDPDSDTVSFVSGTTGTPEIFDLRAIGGPEDAGDFGARVAWLEDRQVFEYTAPDDLDLFAGSETFSYQIKDEYGFTATGSVEVELALPDEDAPQVRANADDRGLTQATASRELFVLGEGPSVLSGTVAQLNGDSILDLALVDAIRVVGAGAGTLVSATRERTEKIAQIGAPEATINSVVGGSTNGALSDSFIGITRLSITDGVGGVAELTLPGFFEDAFVVVMDGDDAVIRYSGADTAVATDGDDDLRGDEGANTLDGLDGDDVLQGLGGDDTLFGGKGSDVLIGGAGRDTLTGGAGADLFVISDIGTDESGAIYDIITDFNPTEGDRILVSVEEYMNDAFTADLDRLDLQSQTALATSLRADLAAEGGSPLGTSLNGKTFVVIGDPQQLELDEGEVAPLPETLAQITFAVANEAPVAEDDIGATDADTAVEIDVLRNDTDLDGPFTLSISDVESTGVLGQVTMTTENTVTYDPNGAFASLAKGTIAQETFSYTVTDGDKTATAEVVVDVTGTFEAPLKTLIEGTDGRDVLTGTDADERIVSRKGSLDLVSGGGGADDFVFGDELNDGTRDRTYIRDFDSARDQVILETTAEFSFVATTRYAALVFDDQDLIRFDGVFSEISELNIIVNAPSDVL